MEENFFLKEIFVKIKSYKLKLQALLFLREREGLRRRVIQLYFSRKFKKYPIFLSPLTQCFFKF